MELQAPTFSALNKPQKRALILRDQLRYVDPQHLNEFIEGLSNDEPPTYTKVNGVIKPELVLVTLKEDAFRFDIGNVLLPEEKNSIHRVYLVVENGQIQMRAEDPLPLDENVLDSQPIHGFIARSTVPLFKEKFQAIYTRMNKINEARRAAYNMPNQAPVLFHEGETIARLDPVKAEQGRMITHTRKSRKRGPNEEVIPHVSNKRKRVTLHTIPEDAKSKTFDTIPSHVKVDLFNSIVKTAFPNYDNLMIAAWNVVSIYSACGSDFPELHRAIVDLKGVLQDFDETFGKRVDRATPSYRHDFGGPSSGDINGDSNQDRDRIRDLGHRRNHQGDHDDRREDHFRTPAPSFVQSEAGNADQFDDTAANGSTQVEDDMYIPVDSGEHIDNMAEPAMPPPRALQLSQPHEGSDDDDEDDDEVPPVDPRMAHRLESHRHILQPDPENVADTNLGGSLATSTHSSPGKQYNEIPRDRIKELREQDGDDVDAEDRARVALQTTIVELPRRGEEGASSIERKTPEETAVAKISALPSFENTAVTKASTADECDSHSENDKPTQQLHNRPTPLPTSTLMPTPRKKKQHNNPERTVAQLEKRYEERKTHILTMFENDMSKVPEKSRNTLLQLEAEIEQRKKDEAPKKFDKKNCKPGETTARPCSASNGMFGTYTGKSKHLGNSVLGPKKTTGVVPVAPMMPPFPNGRRRDPRDGVANGRRGSTPPYGRNHSPH